MSQSTDSNEGLKPVEVTQADREAAAKLLGYRDWDDATDYRLTGHQDAVRDKTVLALAKHRMSAPPTPNEEVERYLEIYQRKLAERYRDEAEQLRNVLKDAREYVVDALDAHEHSDGRDLLKRIDALSNKESSRSADTDDRPLR